MSPILRFTILTLALFSFRSPAKSVECSIEEEPELLSSSVDQTPVNVVSNDHYYTIHTPTINCSPGGNYESSEKARDCGKESIFSGTKDPKGINFYTGFKDYQTLKWLNVALQPTAATMTRYKDINANAFYKYREHYV